MIVNGKDIRFLRTVKINFDIAKVCPGGKISNIGELFEGEDEETYKNMLMFIQLLNQGYEDAKHYEDPSHVPDVISVEEMMFLPFDQMNRLFVEATDAFFGIKQTVEVEPSKSKKKTKEELG